MTNISGNKFVIADADCLIGLIHKTDNLHSRCLKITVFIDKNDYMIFIPYPIVLEAATALAKDKTIRRPDLAARLLKDYSSIDNSKFDTEVGQLVSKLYDPKTSKKNSPFDYYLLALAKKNNIKYIFSFDNFYKKNGLVLIEEMVK